MKNEENYAMPDTSVDLDKVVSTYIKIRDKKNELTVEFNKREEELNEKLDVIKKALLEHCQNTGVESIRTQSGTFYRSVKKKYWTSDWESMNRFIMENEAVDLLEKRIHQGNMRQFLEENRDLLPPDLTSIVSTP
jgi:hypothetical protein